MNARFIAVDFSGGETAAGQWPKMEDKKPVIKEFDQVHINVIS